MRPVISVVIPTYNRRESLQNCLDSLTRQTYRDFQVVVVDGGSSDGTERLIQEYQTRLEIRFSVRSESLVVRMNEAWKISRGSIVVRTDDDVVADPNWLSEIARTFGEGDCVGGVTGPTLVPRERLAYRDVFTFHSEHPDSKRRVMELIKPIYWCIFMEGRPFAIGHIFKSGAWAVGSNFEESTRLSQPLIVDTLEACNMALRRDLIERAGGFDDLYRSVAEWSEIDLCFRVRKMGYRLVFNPKAIVHHIVSRQGPFSQRTFAYDRMLNFLYFYSTHVKADTIDKATRFALYLLFLNAYWLYRYHLSGNRDYLTGLVGTLRGLVKHMPRLVGLSAA